jgi:uncharacterized protein YjbI with pentapeptide repeats
MSNMSQQKKVTRNTTIGIITLLAFFAIFHYYRAERYRPIQKTLTMLEVETNGSSRTLTKSEFLSLQKDIAALRKDALAFEDNALISTVQIVSGAAIFGGFFLTWRGQEQQHNKNNQDNEIAKESLVSERFFGAVELLVSQSCSSRLGGIYTLESITKKVSGDDSSDYKRRTVRILTAFIQDNCSIQDNYSSPKETEDLPTSLDIQVALEVVHDLRKKLWEELQSDNLWPFALNCIRLKKVKFSSKLKYLQQLELQYSYLDDIEFSRSDLTKSRFSESILSDVRFLGSVVLSNSSFRKATLRNVNFEAAILEKVNFRDADFEDVNFRDADLKNADFTGAVLKEVDFTGAKNLESTKGLDLDKLKLASAETTLTFTNQEESQVNKFVKEA